MPDRPLTFFTFCDITHTHGLLPVPIRWMNALERCGHRVIRADSDKIPLTLPEEVDVVLIHHNTAMTRPEMLPGWREQLDRRNGVMVQLIIDLIMRDPACPLEGQHHYEPWSKVWPLLDTVFVKERPIIPELARRGLPTVYMDQGVVTDYLPTSPVAPRADWECDFAFCGNARVPHRVDLLRALEHVGSVAVFCAPEEHEAWDRAGFDVRSPCFGKDLAVLAQSAKVIIGDNYCNDVEGYWSNRLWLTLGAKGCHLTAYVPGIDSAIQNGIHAMLFDDIGDAALLGQVLLRDVPARLDFAKAGYRHALTYHTLEHRCKEVLVPAVRKAIEEKQQGRSTTKHFSPPPVKELPQPALKIAPKTTKKKHILLIAPWTAQGLTTMAVYHGRLLQSLGYQVTYHAWHGIFDDPGWPEDKGVNVANPSSLNLEDTDVAIWYEVTDAAQVARCKEHGITTIWIPMWEYLETAHPDKNVQFDLVVCPTQQTFDIMQGVRWQDYTTALCPWWCDFPVHAPRKTPDVPVFFHCVRGVSGDGRNTTALLEAWKQFKRKNGVGRLLVKCLAPLRRFVKDAPALPDLVVLEGHIPRDHLVRLYQNADCFLYPTRCEGVGLVLLEALCSGLPIVTTGAPPMTEWLKGNNGVQLPVAKMKKAKHGMHAHVSATEIAKTLHHLSPQRIDGLKKDVRCGLDTREQEFREFWRETIEATPTKEMAMRELLGTRRSHKKPHLVIAPIQWGRGRGGGELSLMMIAETAQEMGYEVSCLYEVSVGPMPESIPAKCIPSTMFEQALRESKADVVLADLNRLSIIRAGTDACGVVGVFYVQFWGPMLNYKTLTNSENLDVWLNNPDRPIPPEMLAPSLPELSKARSLVANSEYTADVIRMLVKREPDAIAAPYIQPIANVEGPHDCVMLPSCQWLKGVPELVLLAKRRPHQQFIMLTGDRVRGNTAVDAMIADVRACPNIDVIDGWNMDMANVYARTKVMLLATRTCESYSRATAEARSLGIPVLALNAGNLTRHLIPLPGEKAGDKGGWTRCTQGALVERDASDDAWDTALTYCEGLSLEPDTTALCDQRPRVIKVLNRHRRFSDVAILRPERAPGVRTGIDNLASILGCVSLPWNTGADQLADFAAVIAPGGLDGRLAHLPEHIIVWWCSHLAQMDTSRHEAEALAKLIGSTKTRPRTHIAFTCQADANLWLNRGVSSWWLPPILNDIELTVAKRDGLNVFIPGPYRERKNVFTALGAAALCKAEVHVTGLAAESRGMKELAEAMHVQVTSHPCHTTAQVMDLAGSCQVALAISTAETFSYGAAECVQAGTPTIWWAGIPALARGPKELCVQDPTNIYEIAALIRWAADSGADSLDDQRNALRRSIAPNIAVARETLLGILAQKEGAP